MTEYQELGTIELQPHQHNLLVKFSNIILNGTYNQAVDTFIIIFEREPVGLDMAIFKALCEQKINEQSGDYGIKGVISGGKH